MTEDAREALYRHLADTAELPVERRASRVLGEAEAVADDLRDCGPTVAAERAAVVLDLLAEIDGTGHDEADDHVTAAREAASRVAGKRER